MKTKSFRLTDEDEKILEELAIKYKMSHSELIRFLIRKEYEKLMKFYEQVYAEDFYSEG
jgi:predicted DNA-binding protein